MYRRDSSRLLHAIPYQRKKTNDEVKAIDAKLSLRGAKQVKQSLTQLPLLRINIRLYAEYQQDTPKGAVSFSINSYSTIISPLMGQRPFYLFIFYQWVAPNGTFRFYNRQY